MANVYNAHPEFKGMVDRILTGEMFARSKPAPDCFLLEMCIRDRSYAMSDEDTINDVIDRSNRHSDNRRNGIL